ncbi:hypothetical protein LJ707_06570 [Mucilaginibacter sp. UR6-1]|uniref:hypothetical protein n=1 Tax=Mucilaginibacter sp. UR6-1 TaxID=1435643 RepID=UPI001E3F0B57|nr:hypothetical protein [Mucilaginibacter sp. UR6-1]MCC8408586.1 hypothetical protein [Mucilaginibacter sp. UR6-1]
MKDNNIFSLAWNKLKACVCLVFLLQSHHASAQTELMPWGNIIGYRIDGQLMEFESNLSVVKNNWQDIVSTGKEKQRPKYDRKGTQQIVTTTINQLSFTETVEEKGANSADIKVKVQATEDAVVDGIYIMFTIAEVGGIKTQNIQALLTAKTTMQQSRYTHTPVKFIRFVSAQRQMQLTFSEPTALIFKRGNGASGGNLQVYIPIHTGSLSNGAIAEKRITIKSSGVVDKTPVVLTINANDEGRAFDGLGGNFRLQNPKTDPQVIDYSLQNLRVAWGRAEMPWRFWQPVKDSNPIDSAKAGKIHQHVKASMEIAQRLYKLGMPVILSAWSGPDWAIEGAPKFRPGPDGVWGNPLNKDNMQAIYKSIGDYIVYLNDTYGVEVSMFSFNESDLGINIRQTGQEHAALIKGLGAYFESRGLKTKLLLGDNSDATTYEFIYPAINDAATHKYIGAISFHSWRGWEKQTLQKWADAATKTGKPLIVGEGSIDAQAWGYPAVFEEPFYALEEINLYTRLLNICQPASILQWQLTADYSPLVGGGIFDNDEPLRPTQRFGNLKQLASIPAGLKALSAKSNKPSVSVAALGDKATKIYSIQIVNNGPTRTANISGLPLSIKSLNVYVTDKTRSMKQVKPITLKNGKSSFILEKGTYTTLTNN